MEGVQRVDDAMCIEMESLLGFHVIVVRNYEQLRKRLHPHTSFGTSGLVLPGAHQSFVHRGVPHA